MPEPPLVASPGWSPPVARLRRGKCWVKLQRLSHEELASVEREFRARNPGWVVVESLDIDPFTGWIKEARCQSGCGEPGQLSEPEAAQRRLAPLSRNADLLGWGPDELARLEWQTRNMGNAEATSAGLGARAEIPCKTATIQQLIGRMPCWGVNVGFYQGGVVRKFYLSGSEPPPELCLEPGLSAEQARRARGLVDASAQPKRLGRDAFTVKPDEIGEAHLSVDLERDDDGSETWRLVWEVKVHQGLWGFLVDAYTGQTVGLRKNFIE
ncbi:MAG TPA: hypothetical protein VNG33_04805 [Polyangiaceae bacterium]|nr:hypothetical protein [Polyangiaceae bacterium]